MKSLDEQFKVAVEIAKQPNANVIVLCKIEDAATAFRGAVKDEAGTLSKQCMQWNPEGSSGVLRVYSIPSGGEGVFLLAGINATHIFIAEGMNYTDQEISFLVSRLRSPKYEGALELFMPEGFVTSFRSY